MSSLVTLRLRSLRVFRRNIKSFRLQHLQETECRQKIVRREQLGTSGLRTPKHCEAWNEARHGKARESK